MCRIFIVCACVLVLCASSSFARDNAFVLTLDDISRTSIEQPLSIDQNVAPPLASAMDAPKCAFAEQLADAASDSGLPADLVIAVAYAETRCRHEGQRSPKGAIGLMQLMPATARRFGAEDPWDIGQNIAAATAYLAWLDSRFHGDLSRILAGYNAGEGAVDRHNGVPPFAETQSYVAGILQSLEIRWATPVPARARVEPTFVIQFDADQQDTPH